MKQSDNKTTIRTLTQKEVITYARKAKTRIDGKGYVFQRLHSVVEGGIEYRYGRVTAESLAAWSKLRIAAGKNTRMKEFVDQLHKDRRELKELRISRYTG
jgi:hypothetical protein